MTPSASFHTTLSQALPVATLQGPLTLWHAFAMVMKGRVMYIGSGLQRPRENLRAFSTCLVV